MSEYSFLICELAAAFAGFTAIVSVLDSRSAESRRLDRARLRGMLEVSLFAVGAGLLPSLLPTIGFVGDSAWQAAAVVMTIGGGVLFRVQNRRGFSPEIQAEPGYSLAYARFIRALGATGFLGFAFAATGVFAPAGLYLISLTLALVIAGLQFLRTASSVLDD